MELHHQERVQCAMWLALGRQTSMSRSGSEVVFSASARKVTGCSSASTEYGIALQQLTSVGIGIESITAQSIEAFRAWKEQRSEMLRQMRQRIIVTREYVRGGILMRSVKYLDGLQSKAVVTKACKADDDQQLHITIRELQAQYGVEAKNIQIH